MLRENIRLVLEAVSLNKPSNDIISKLQVMYSEKTIEFTCSEINENILSYYKILKFLLSNPLSNALKYSNKGDKVLLKVNRLENNTIFIVIIPAQKIGVLHE
jgi:signal transduction histidine kinase